ncbi:bifunctional biotin--[acetyl-CoA-carboxylase] ligase/biotin operon repressor BirA [Rodentibacter caecimuris]|uniref:biotin--[biotin carboxyl-carrier protein] ligase n=1 Tax=Rodentibacter caecimuris TaxID=1796644 RepID=A0ABX3KYM3_9PAST|nr:biotin--[acetyl-CoA-carboxylase] ligase [Rodentibacter heylii]
MNVLLNYLSDCLPKVRSDIMKLCSFSEIQLQQEIEAMRKQGLNIIEDECNVYLVPELPLLNLNKISTALSPYNIYYHSIISSTNEFILDNMDTLHKGDLCLTEYQSAGRGRRGRQWFSPFAGQIMFSFYWTLNPKMNFEGLSLIVGLAIAETLEAKVKWPNDILLFGRKLAGILIEISKVKNGQLNLVIGVGINVSIPKQINVDQSYAQLTEIQPEINRDTLIPQLIHNIYDHLTRFEKKGIDQYIQKKWQQFDEYFGSEVNIIKEKEIISGIAQGINEHGYIRLAHLEETLYFNAGEVSLRKK